MRIFGWVVLFAVSCAAQTIQIVTPSSSQVVQRGVSGKADIVVSGTAVDAEGRAVEARLLRGIVPVFGFTTKKYGTVEGGRFNFTLGGIPSGGPYRLEVKLAGTKVDSAIDPLFVGDVWILAGQSNMEGVGNLVNVHPPEDKVRMFDMVQETWQIAKEPPHNLPGSVDSVHWRLNAQKEPERLTGEKLIDFNANRKKGAGLGLPFAAAYEKAADVPVGLIPCAHGGTSMDQWDPAKFDRNNPGTSLYGSMIRRVQAASGGKVKGVLWYQGESDANPKAAPIFRDKFQGFIAKVREDLAQPDLPFYFVQIGRHVNDQNQDPWNQVQEIQRQLGTTIPNAAVFAAIDSDLDDQIHVSTTDLKRLGENMAKFAAGKAKRGPTLVSALVDGSTIRVTYSDVNGKLTTKDRLSGFSLHAATGEEIPAIYKEQIDANGSSVILHFGGKLPEGAVLHYGAGKNPYCNLRDEMGFGAPVFGPLPLKQQ